jgi:hypothetical protein
MLAGEVAVMDGGGGHGGGGHGGFGGGHHGGHHGWGHHHHHHGDPGGFFPYSGRSRREGRAPRAVGWLVALAAFVIVLGLLAVAH